MRKLSRILTSVVVAASLLAINMPMRAPTVSADPPDTQEYHMTMTYDGTDFDYDSDLPTGDGAYLNPGDTIKLKIDGDLTGAPADSAINVRYKSTNSFDDSAYEYVATADMTNTEVIYTLTHYVHVHHLDGAGSNYTAYLEIAYRTVVTSNVVADVVISGSDPDGDGLEASDTIWEGYGRENPPPGSDDFEFYTTFDPESVEIWPPHGGDMMRFDAIAVNGELQPTYNYKVNTYELACSEEGLATIVIEGVPGNGIVLSWANSGADTTGVNIDDYAVFENGSATIAAVYDENMNNVSEYYDLENGCVNENGIGQIVVQGDYYLEFEFVPDRGYQLWNFGASTSEFQEDVEALAVPEKTNHYYFQVPNDRAVVFQSEFREMEDVVDATESMTVSEGTITLSDGTLVGGSGEVIIDDSMPDTDLEQAIQDTENTGDYKVISIDLNNIFVMANTDGQERWEDVIEDLDGSAEITLKLDGLKVADGQKVIILHQHGDTIEEIEGEYDAATKTVTFTVSGFSDFAFLAVDESEDPEDPQNPVDPVDPQDPEEPQTPEEPVDPNGPGEPQYPDLPRGDYYSIGWTYSSNSRTAAKPIEHATVSIVSVQSPGENGEWMDENGRYGLDQGAGEADAAGVGSLEVAAGDLVTAQILPDYGYQVTNVSVIAADGSTVDVQPGEQPATYAFEMPDSAVAIEANVVPTENTVLVDSTFIFSARITLNNIVNENGTFGATIQDISLNEIPEEALKTVLDACSLGNPELKFFTSIDLYNLCFKGNTSLDEAWVKAISEPNFSVTFELVMADQFVVPEGKTPIIATVHGDEIIYLECDWDPATRTLSFTTDKFSGYGFGIADAPKTDSKIAAADTATATPTPTSAVASTGEQMSRMPVVGLILIMAAGVVFAGAKREETDR